MKPILLCFSLLLSITAYAAEDTEQADEKAQKTIESLKEPLYSPFTER